MKTISFEYKFNEKSEYSICRSCQFFDIDEATISLLYQPIIKPIAVAFYKLLLSEAMVCHITMPSLHSRILKILNINFAAFYEAKNALEAIGLLKTYLNKKVLDNGEEQRQVIYFIYPPLTPKSFFNHFYLNQKLAFILGELDYERTRQFFLSNLPDVEKMENVSKSFSEVFDIKSDLIEEENVINKKMESREKIDTIKELFESINKNLELVGVTFRVKNAKTASDILNIISEYNIDNYFLANIIYDAEQLEMPITVTTIKKLIEKKIEIQEDYLSTMINNSSSEYSKDKVIKEVIHEKIKKEETLLPKMPSQPIMSKPITHENPVLSSIFLLAPADYYLLLTKRKKMQIFIGNMIENLKHDYKLNNQLINFLILFSWKKNGYINENYVYRLSDTFMNKNIKTVKDAATDLLLKLGENKKFSEIIALLSPLTI